MKRIIFIFSAACFITSCGQVEKQEEAKKFIASFNDNSVYASTPVPQDEDDVEIDHIMADASIVKWIFEDVLNREDAEFYEHEEKRLTKEEVNSIIKSIRTINAEDPDNPGTFFEITDTLKIEPKDVIEIVSKESWSFDKDQMAMEKKVSFIAPVIKVFDDEGAERGKKVLFWIKMN